MTLRRRLFTVGAAAFAVGMLVLLAVTLIGNGSGDAVAPVDEQGAFPARTVSVEQRDLVDTVEADGTLGYGDRRSVRGRDEGTVTALPELGAVIEANQPLYEVDGGAGPIVFTGDLPMWRTLRSGVDDGADVAQLEANLAFFGYTDEDFVADETFAWETREAIEDWQNAHGLEETGELGLADVYFASDPVRIAELVAAPGDPATGEILQITGTDRLVHVDLDATYSQYARWGESVAIELADGAEITGMITDVATTADVTPEQSGQPASATVAVEITPDESVDALDESPATVSFVSSKVEDALAVPLEAVVATAAGGFALEVVDDANATRLVVVELGRFADGWVQVIGEVSAGQTVVTA